MVYYIDEKNRSPPRMRQKGRSVITNQSYKTPTPEQEAPRAPVGTYILLSLIAAYLTFATVVANSYTSVVAIILILAYSLAFMRSRTTALLVGAAVAFFYLSTGSISSVGAVLSFVFAIGMGAASLMHLKKFWCLLLAVLACVAIWLVSGDVSAIFYALSTLVPAVLLWLVISRGMRRIPALCLLSAVFLAMILVPFAMVLAQEYNGLSQETLSLFIEDVHDEFLRVTMESSQQLPEEYRAIMTESFFSSVFDSVLLLSPAILIACANIVSFFVHLLALALCRMSGRLRDISRKVLQFDLSRPSAVVFLISLVVMLLGLGTSDTGILISVVLQNLCIILFPPFILVGGLGVYHFLRSRPGCLNTWVIVVLIFFAIYSGLVLAIPLALLGAIMTLRRKKNDDPS